MIVTALISVGPSRLPLLSFLPLVKYRVYVNLNLSDFRSAPQSIRIFTS